MFILTNQGISAPLFVLKRKAEITVRVDYIQLMKRIFLAALLLLALAALLMPLLGMAGGGYRLADKDYGKGKHPNAVALKVLNNPRKVIGSITTNPRNTRIEWAWTADCNQEDDASVGVERDLGNFGSSPAKFTIKLPPGSHAECEVAAWGKIQGVDAGKSITAKIKWK